ncbi:MAG: polyketide synthase [Pseudomonadales bacterium]|nr:polyketide synthase [Pseudomonadales bacterium]
MTAVHNLKALSPVKMALKKIQLLQSELVKMKQEVSAPIAIVGESCRLPGNVNSPGDLWELLINERDALSDLPSGRWDSRFNSDVLDEIGTLYCQRGGYISEVDCFDAAFFDISPREARHIDPQQRLLLEQTWHVMENAGLSLDAIQAPSTGVFVGICTDDYDHLSVPAHAKESINALSGLGLLRSIAAGRISYALNLNGPTLAVDTACSSSLTAIHLACQSIRNRECDFAFAGGVNLMLTPDTSIGLSRLRALSATGACRSFSDEADGYVRGEGCGLVLLQRLSDAIKQGRTIKAVIRGSAINHDGRSNGLTAPSGLAQEAVIRMALVNAQVTPAQVGYVEAHGTGTPLGDPIEIRALSNVYCRGVNRSRPLLVGSIKSNIGHLEGAASIASVIKVTQSLKRSYIPTSLHSEKLSTLIDWSKCGVTVANTGTQWIAADGELPIAGVSAFGMSGTNVHLILEQYPVGPEGIDASFLNSKGFGGNNATALVMAPHVVKRMLAKRHGQAAVTQYQSKLEASTQSAEEYNQAAIRGEIRPKYQFGEQIKDGDDLKISTTKIEIDGYRHSIDVKSSGMYSDLTRK